MREIGRRARIGFVPPRGKLTNRIMNVDIREPERAHTLCHRRGASDKLQ